MATIKEWKHTNGYEVGETLPSVSSDDNGKVLGVSDGAWAVVSGGGGGGSEPLIVILTSSADFTTVTMDKTWQEIYDAFLSGQPIICRTPFDLSAVVDIYGDEEEEEFTVTVFRQLGSEVYTASGYDGYPSHSNGEA